MRAGVRPSILSLLLLCAPFAVPETARAVSVRVDWSSTAQPLISPWLDPVFLSGSFGVFDLPDGDVFPLALPLTAPFEATTLFGPDPSRNVYTFLSSGGLGFAFGSPTFGRLVRFEAPGSAAGFTTPASNHRLHLNLVGSPPEPSISASFTSEHTGSPEIWAGALDYQFTVVPEPASALLLSIGLLGLRGRSRK